MDLIHEDSNHAMLGAIDRYELDLVKWSTVYSSV